MGMMNIWTMVACVVVAALGLLTVILGIAGTASAAQSLVRDNHGVVSCKYEASPAVGCGAVAALLALTTQLIVASAATGCCGCCRSWGIPGEAKRIVAVVLSTFSWILSITVVILFMVGAIVSTGGDLPVDDGDRCVPPGTAVFAAATILFIVMVIFQIASYILLEATAVGGFEKALAQESGIAVGQPEKTTLDSADQKAAAGGDPAHPSAPAVLSSEVNLDPPPPSAPAASSSEASVDPPPHSIPATSPKASAGPTSQV